MAWILGDDSYVSLAQANSYVSTGPSSATWAALPDSAPDGVSKNGFLRESYRILCSWPRADLPRTSEDQLLGGAQIELALWLINNYKDFSSQFGHALGLDSISMGDLSMNFHSSGAQLPERVEWMLKDYRNDNAFVSLVP